MWSRLLVSSRPNACASREKTHIYSTLDLTTLADIGVCVSAILEVQYITHLGQNSYPAHPPSGVFLVVSVPPCNPTLTHMLETLDKEPY
jgi:hypothetical protein